MSNNTMLFNKYRPRILDNIIGQNKVVVEFKKRFKERNIPRVILFQGISGTGKTSLSRIIGKGILCNNLNDKGEPCNNCIICNAIDEGKSNGFFFELNSSNLGINETRELVKDTKIKNFSQAKAKVFCIDELQTFSKAPAALSNLLKPLEEDLQNSYFIFSSMGDYKSIPKAILNRCSVYKLKDLGIEDISRQLVNICKEQGIEINTEEKANVIVTIADNSYGSMRQAISYLERVIYSDIWTMQELIGELDIISNTSLIESINYLFNGNDKAFEIVYNNDLLQRLRFILGLIYKSINNITISKWDSIQLQGLNKKYFNNDNLIYALNQLFELNKFPYVNQEMIDFSLVNIFLFNNKKSIQENGVKKVIYTAENKVDIDTHQNSRRRR